jgi:hypothetical protein
MRLAPLVALCATAFVPAVARAGDAPAPAPAPAPVTITVKTTLVPPPELGAPMTPPKPGSDPIVQQPPMMAELDAGTAVAGAAVAAKTHGFTGLLEAGPAKFAVGVVLGDDGHASLFVDADRDGAMDVTKERYEARAGATATEARFDDVRVGDVKARALVRRMPASFNGGIQIPNGTRRPEAKPLAFAEAKPAAIAKAPELPGTVRYASVALGTTTIHVAVGRSADAIAALVDDKADLATAKPVELRASGMRRGVRTYGTRWEAMGLTVGGATFNLLLSAVEENAFAQFQGPGARTGSVDVDGAKQTLYLVDGDFDG